MRRLIAMQLERPHRLVRHLEGLLEFRLNRQQPVEVIRIVVLPAELADGIHAPDELAADLRRIVDDHGETTHGRVAERAAHELQDVLEITRAGTWAGQHHREGLLPIRRIHEDADQIQDLLRRAGTARIHDDAVREPYKGLEALLDVRHDHELIDDRVGRLRGNDAGLGDADVASVLDALLRVSDCGTLHRSLHGARAATGAHVQAA